MVKFCINFCVLGCLVLAPPLSANEKVAEQRKAKAQVLFLGDSLQRTIVEAAAKELAGQVEIHYPQNAAYDSGTALAQIEELLGNKKWQIIYFNFGLGDLFYKDPATRDIRIMCKHAGGVRVSTASQYEQRLDALAKRLKTTGAKLIWGNTTPLKKLNYFPSQKENIYDENSEEQYNSIAARVMKKYNIPIVDLHGYVMAQFKKGESHPGYPKYAAEMAKRGHPLHAPLVRALQTVADR